MSTRRMCVSGLAGAGTLLCAALAAPLAAQVTQRVSVDSNGAEGNDASVAPSISADGRYTAFHSWATNLVSGDTNGMVDVFVRDRQLGVTERVSVDSAGAQANFGYSRNPSISADGRYVAFYSSAASLVSGDTNGNLDVFVRDRQVGVTERVSLDSSGAEGNANSYDPSISADGRYVVFYSLATNLVIGDLNGTTDVFVRDRQLGVTKCVSIDSAGAPGNYGSSGPSISADGRYVALYSFATNLVSGDTNGTVDIFVRDLQLGVTERVSVDSSGAQGNAGNSISTNPNYETSISADGRYVAFYTFASNLVSGDTNGEEDVFVRDRQLGLTERVSVDSAGAQGNGSSYNGSISADGRCVAFYSSATNLFSADYNGFFSDVFVRDRQFGVTEHVSVNSAGVQGTLGSYEPSISADGRFAAFHCSPGTILISGDTNGAWDIYVRDRFGGPSFTSLCYPGVGGVIACPCANPPSSSGRGCDNSSATDGAILLAAGGTYLSSDSLVFTTSRETPTATSIVLQGNALISAGAVQGQGVLCAGGSLELLYAKVAVGGSITAPDFSAGDPPVSVRSAALGDVILPGQSRWYLVYYRDPIVLGGCPAASTFNVTQTGEIAWSP